MGSRLEDKIAKAMRALEEMENSTKVRTTFNWSDWSHLSIAEKMAQADGMKIINIPETGVDISTLRRIFEDVTT